MKQTLQVHRTKPSKARRIAGDAEISWDDLGRLLEQGGECCVPVVR